MAGLTQEQRNDIQKKFFAPRPGTQVNDVSARKARIAQIAKQATEAKEPAGAPEEQKGLFTRITERAGQVLKGGTKEAINQFRNISSLGEKGLRAVTGLVPGVKKVGEKTAAEKMIEEQTFDNGYEKFGSGLVQFGEFLLPGGAATKLGKAAEGAKILKNLPGVAKKAVGLVTKAGTEAGLAGGTTSLQKGEIGEDATRAAKYGAIFPVAGATLKKVAGAVGKGMAELLGKTTGAGSQSIKQAFNNPAVVKYARETGKRGVDEVMEEALLDAKKGLLVLKKERGAEYSNKLLNLKMDKSLSPILNETKETVANLADDLETIVEGENVVNRAIGDISRWSDDSAVGLDVLKKRLQSYENQLLSSDKSAAKRIVSTLKSQVRSGLEDNVPGYKEMTKGYSSASSLIDEITGALSLGDRKQKETAIRKLLQTVKRDEDSRKNLLEAVGKASGVDIANKVSGTMLSDAFPKGIAGKVFTGVTGISAGAGFGNPAFWVGLVPYAVASSPRVVGELANIAGQLSKLSKNEKVSAQLQRLMRQTLIELQD